MPKVWGPANVSNVGPFQGWAAHIDEKRPKQPQRAANLTNLETT
jgi:hypothetical protein